MPAHVWMVLPFPLAALVVLGVAWFLWRTVTHYQRARRAVAQERAQLYRNLALLLRVKMPPGGPDA